jgi:TM2 domain-containing membrane protein YozV
LFKSILLSTFLLLFFQYSNSKATASEEKIVSIIVEHNTALKNEVAPQEFNVHQTNKIKLITLLQKATVENKKVTAAILTLTLGMLGVHRIYLGTAPYIPAVYLFTFGGGFFVLPIIDLVMILSTNDISKFENNNKLLMWTGE